MKLNDNTRKMALTALCLALCVVLPLAFHAIPGGGMAFSPMHIPVFLCGLACGPLFGLICGIGGPILSHLLTSMPPVAFLPGMALELAVYGLIAGLCMHYIHTQKETLDVYLSLVSAMLVGRLVAGLANAWIFQVGNYNLQLWLTAYFLKAWPGLLLHLVLVPAIYLALVKAQLLPQRYADHRH